MLGRLVGEVMGFIRRGGSRPLGDAEAARRRGDWMAAAANYRSHLARSPGDAAASNDLGIVLCELGDFTAAQEQFESAIAADAGLASAHLNLGHLCMRRQAYREALACYLRVLEIDPGQAEARGQAALAHYELGEVRQALELLDADCESDLLHGEYSLFITNALAGHDPRAHAQAHRRWGDLLESTAPPPRVRSAAAAGSTPRKIRIGYVSADFREHAVARFLLPVFEGHDRSSFDVFCYANQAGEDAITAAIRRMPLEWRAIHALDDAAAADLIAADGIDILVDLSGHTRGNRLGVFARQPASLQASWLGYLNTTGMKSIRYRISDSAMDPAGLSDVSHSESLLRLDPAGWCYRAPVEAPEVSPAPGDARGYVTFGSFNHVAKLNDRVLECWSGILEACPDSRLNMVGIPDAATAARLRRSFLDRGIGEERISLLPRLPRTEFLRAMADVDIALDPFPYCGGTTTCESLWMGLPVIALAGDFGFARSSAAILAQAGFAEFVTDSPENYVRKAVDLAATGVQSHRQAMRDTMRTSALMDEAAFVRRLEDAYRRIIAA